MTKKDFLHLTLKKKWFDLIASGETQVNSIEHIERGYPNLVNVLTNLGADIRCE